MLSEEGIDQHPIATEGWTRENLVVLDEATGLQYRFGMPGPLMHEAEWERCLEMLAALDPAPAYLVASGSLPPGVPEDAYAQFARTAHDQGTRLIVDTSGAALRATLRESVFLLKPNMAEMAVLAGRKIEGGGPSLRTKREAHPYRPMRGGGRVARCRGRAADNSRGPCPPACANGPHPEQGRCR